MKSGERVEPKPPMTSTGPAYRAAHYVCPVCGNVAKLPSDGKPGEVPWCSHGDGMHWLTAERVALFTKDNAERPIHRRWVKAEYAEVHIGKPYASPNEPWGQEVVE